MLFLLADGKAEIAELASECEVFAVRICRKSALLEVELALAVDVALVDVDADYLCEEHGMRAEQLALGDATIDILGPIWYSSNMNDLSLIIKITYGSTSFLFTGDAEWDEEHDLLEAGIDISANVLKVAHHGSDSSTSYVFLREVAPTYAVISVSKESQYGHPHSETLNRLEDAGVIVYRTDIQGTIECISDGETISFLQ